MRAPVVMKCFASLCAVAACCGVSAQSFPIVSPSQVLAYPTGIAAPSSGDKYGFGCGFAADGNRMLVAAAVPQAGGGAPASLFFYAKNSSGKWYYAKRITPRSGGEFRCTVSLKGDTAVIAGEEAGVGVVYVLRNTSGTIWSLTQVIQKQAAALQLGPDFLAIGNYAHAANRGIVYFYKRISAAKYSYLSTVRGADYGLNFGLIDGGGPNTLVVGQSTNEGDDQAEFVYQKSGDVWSLNQTFSYGWRSLGSAAYQPGYVAVENTVYHFAEIYEQTNIGWYTVQFATADCNASHSEDFLTGPIALGGNRLVAGDEDTNDICMSELHDGLFKGTAILKPQYDGGAYRNYHNYYPLISGNSVFIRSAFGPVNSAFSGDIEVFNFGTVTN